MMLESSLKGSSMNPIRTSLNDVAGSVVSEIVCCFHPSLGIVVGVARKQQILVGFEIEVVTAMLGVVGLVPSLKPCLCTRMLWV